MNWLLEKKYLLSTSNYFCSICLGYAKEKGSITTKVTNNSEKAVTAKTIIDKNDSILKVVELTENNKITNDEMNLLWKTTGESIGKNIFARIQNDLPKTQYKNLNDTMNIRIVALIKSIWSELIRVFYGKSKF